MRRIVLFNHVSADGYFSDPNGGLSWVVQDPAIYQASKEGMPASDLILFGRRTYDMFAAFWPHALEGGVPDPHGHQQNPAMQEMATFLNETAKIVFSHTLEPTWKNTTVLRQLDPAEVQAIKNRPGADIIMFGSGSIVTQLSEHRLIDEYQLVISPVLLGGGRDMVCGLPGTVPLELLAATSFDSGTVLLRYAPVR